MAPQHMQDYCWICLRTRALLKSLRPMVPIEGHHIIEVKCGGKDERDNLLIVCKECHSGIHRIRESFDRYTIYTEQ
jgi:5-methylcytosine-specific restriction endonuclease McrA